MAASTPSDHIHRSPRLTQVLEKVADRLGDRICWAGTVLDTETARTALLAGPSSWCRRRSAWT